MITNDFFKDWKTLFIEKKRKTIKVSQKEYVQSFKGKEREAFKHAIEARKFEIQMYWTRTAYFWTLSAAALTGFFVVSDKKPKIDSFVISCIGIILSIGWALANKGSKYWHENWENHVQMLEDVVIGPLHKTHLYRGPEPFRLRYDWVSQVLTGPSGFSVSKINSIFSWFFVFIWLFLAYTVIPKASPYSDYKVLWRYVAIAAATTGFVFVLFRYSGSWVHDQEHLARKFGEKIV